MRGAPRQWDVGSNWIGDGGIYPGMGDSIALAGTSPELVQTGLWNDGGAVGDPPYDPYQAASFEGSIGAGVAGGPGGSRGVAPAPSGDGIDPAHILAGGISAAVLGVALFWWHHHISDSQKGHSPIRWTIGEVGLVTIGVAVGMPALKSGATWLGENFAIAAPLADWINAA